MELVEYMWQGMVNDKCLWKKNGEVANSLINGDDNNNTTTTAVVVVVVLVQM